jgi:hypothetical protein
VSCSVFQCLKQLCDKVLPVFHVFDRIILNKLNMTFAVFAILVILHTRPSMFGKFSVYARSQIGGFHEDYSIWVH